MAREDIFISTKIWASQYLTEGTVEKSLELLGTDYIDLMFIHQPAGDFMAGYRKLEKAYKEGKIKSIGISNFQGAELKKLLEECEIKPHVIQMEAHPYYRDEETISALAPCGSRAMQVGATVVSARRAGTTATFDELNKYFTINNMPVASSQYWNMVHGYTPEDVYKDEEGCQIMRTLGKNMAFLIKCIRDGKEKYGLPKMEEHVFTAFIQ